MKSFKDQLKTRLIDPIFQFLKQGISPVKLALCIAVGLVLGLFPIIGVTSILCLIVALIFKLNVAVMQLVNYFVYPLQIILIIPLIKVGSWIFGVNPIPYTIDQMIEMFKNNTLLALEKLWLAVTLGISAWAIIIVPLGLVFFLIIRLVLLRLPKVPNAG